MALPLLADLHRAWPLTRDCRRGAPLGRAALSRWCRGVADTVVLEGGGGREALRRVAYQRRAIWPRVGSMPRCCCRTRFSRRGWCARAGIRRALGDRARLARTTADARHARGRRTYGHQVEYYQALGAALGLPAGEPFASVTVSAIGARRAHDAPAPTHGIGDATRYVVFAPAPPTDARNSGCRERFAELRPIARHARSNRTVLVGAKADAAACARRDNRLAARASSISAGRPICRRWRPCCRGQTPSSPTIPAPCIWQPRSAPA